jgi:prenyltransferase beta subunit
MRQTLIGINGRTGKIPDSCYCFWVLATTRIIGKCNDLFEESVIIEFLMNCQNSQIVKYELI